MTSLLLMSLTFGRLFSHCQSNHISLFYLFWMLHAFCRCILLLVHYFNKISNRLFSESIAMFPLLKSGIIEPSWVYIIKTIIKCFLLNQNMKKKILNILTNPWNSDWKKLNPYKQRVKQSNQIPLSTLKNKSDGLPLV